MVASQGKGMGVGFGDSHLRFMFYFVRGTVFL